MIAEFHLLRPYWLLTLLPLLLVIGLLFRQKSASTTWSRVCDEHLLPYLLQTKTYNRHTLSLLLLLISALLMVISLAGPTWSRLPVPTYQKVQPRVFVLDMSEVMTVTDLQPDRLSRAKFKLHDIFQQRSGGQYGLVVYTEEPFVVSPLTDDAETIDSLLSSLTTDIMPVQGQNLSSALEQAKQLITEAGFQTGQVLVFTAADPSRESIEAAKKLAANGIESSIMPVLSVKTTKNSAYQQFAAAGHGQLIPFTDTSTSIEQWLATRTNHSHYAENEKNDMPIWKDQGRWFLIPALLLLLPAFRRGWLS